ncbi:MAG: hypothetical protein J4N31_01490, partial [Chloroflexi bacterium]|nr:hypothetical protein [Chloroflexota bacterium]
MQLRTPGWALASLVLIVTAAACSTDATPTQTFDLTPTGDPERLRAGEVYRTLDADWTRTSAVDALAA